MKRCRPIILLFGLIALTELDQRVFSQSANPPASNLHRHVGTSKSGGVDIPEFLMVETSLETGMTKENLRVSRTKKYEAFTIDGTRLFVAERGTQKTFEVKGLPLEWRPFSDLTWTKNETLLFDRWPQPHYGVHYAVNVKSRKLIVAAPFRD